MYGSHISENISHKAFSFITFHKSLLYIIGDFYFFPSLLQSIPSKFKTPCYTRKWSIEYISCSRN